MRVLNWFFHGFHLGLTLFTGIGWIFPSLRTVHLAVCALTLLSWFGIGLAIGRPGFCIVTELHFLIRRRLMLQVHRESYLLFLARQISRREPDPAKVALGAQAVFYLATAASAGLALFT